MAGWESGGFLSSLEDIGSYRVMGGENAGRDRGRVHRCRHVQMMASGPAEAVRWTQWTRRQSETRRIKTLPGVLQLAESISEVSSSRPGLDCVCGRKWLRSPIQTAGSGKLSPPRSVGCRSTTVFRARKAPVLLRANPITCARWDSVPPSVSAHPSGFWGWSSCCSSKLNDWLGL